MIIFIKGRGRPRYFYCKIYNFFHIQIYNSSSSIIVSTFKPKSKRFLAIVLGFSKNFQNLANDRTSESR